MIEERATLQLGDGAAMTVLSGEAHEVEAALPLFGGRVRLMRATRPGELEVLLESGQRNWVPVSYEYEN